MSKIMINGEEFPVCGGQSGEIYSTDEMRIGTWFDGKPLYRRMYKFNLPSENNAIFLVAPLPENVSVKKLHGYIDRDTYIYMFPLSIYRDDLKVFMHICVRKESNDIRLSFYGNGENAHVFYGQPAIAFVEYTKNTDTQMKSVEPDGSEVVTKSSGSIAKDGTQYDYDLPSAVSGASSVDGGFI